MFNGCMVLAKMHIHFDKMVTDCIEEEAMSEAFRDASMLEASDLDTLSDLVDYMANAVPKKEVPKEVLKKEVPKNVVLKKEVPKAGVRKTAVPRTTVPKNTIPEVVSTNVPIFSCV